MGDTRSYETGTLLVGDCLQRLAELPTGSFDAVVTDPPYFRVAGEAWDRQWEDRATFITWLGEVLAECHRLLKPTGSLYVFASPQLSAYVQVEIGKRFHVLNEIVWQKPDGFHKRSSREALRTFHSGETERLIFAEPVHDSTPGCDTSRQYKNKDHDAAAEVYEPLRTYLVQARDAAGYTTAQVNKALGFAGMAGHWFSASQWVLPSEDNYNSLVKLFGAALPRTYADVRAEYDRLRVQWEARRRYFDLGPDRAERPSGTVWRFAGDREWEGRHPCQKPVPLLRHIIATSVRPGETVLDPFMGSGTTAVAAIMEGVRWVGCEAAEKYLAHFDRRVKGAEGAQQALL